MQLCREVGTSIEAIPHPDLESIPGHRSKVRRRPHAIVGHELTVTCAQRIRVSGSILDLTSQISRLQAETEKLDDQLSFSEDQTRRERVVRQEAEEKARRLEGELSTARMDMGQLQHENTRLQSVNEQIVKRIKRSDHQVKQAWSVLHRLGPDPYGCDTVS